jgi:hypothetical protein
MIDDRLTTMLEGDWVIAAARVTFIALIYGFLFLVLRTTARELAVAARSMSGDGGRPAQATLVLLDGAGSSLPPGHSWSLQAMTSIGRVDENDLVVDDPHMSAHHAELRFDRGQWWLRDLGSRNGTLLNGEPVRAVVAVRHGDVLQCGRVRFQLVSSYAVPI